MTTKEKYCKNLKHSSYSVIFSWLTGFLYTRLTMPCINFLKTAENTEEPAFLHWCHFY